MCAIDNCERRVFCRKSGLCATHQPSLQQRLFAKVMAAAVAKSMRLKLFTHNDADRVA